MRVKIIIAVALIMIAAPVSDDVIDALDEYEF